MPSVPRSIIACGAVIPTRAGRSQPSAAKPVSTENAVTTSQIHSCTFSSEAICHHQAAASTKSAHPAIVWRRTRPASALANGLTGIILRLLPERRGRMKARPDFKSRRNAMLHRDEKSGHAILFTRHERLCMLLALRGGRTPRMARKIVRILCAIAAACAFVLPGAASAAGKTKLHWYGQAAWKIVTPSGGVILIDPWLTVPTNPDKNSIDELTRVDYILITHGHRDHIGDAVEIGKKTGAILVAPYGLQFNMKSMLGYPEKQATAATGGNVGGTIDLPKAGAKVVIVNAIHGSELTPPNITPAPGGPSAITSGNPVGYVIEIKGGPTIYHTGDTAVYEDMQLIPRLYHKIDVMLACIGGHFTMDPVGAALATKFVNPKHVIPMHYGTFSLLAGTPEEFKHALRKYHLDKRLIVLKPGGDIEF